MMERHGSFASRLVLLSLLACLATATAWLVGRPEGLPQPSYDDRGGAASASTSLADGRAAPPDGNRTVRGCFWLGIEFVVCRR